MSDLNTKDTKKHEEIIMPGLDESITTNKRKKMRVLFLDDRTKRIHAAIERYKDDELTIVTNVKECLRHMSANDYDIISLDHDLEGCDFEDPDSSNVGMEVVRYLEKTGWPGLLEGGMLTNPTFIVHSSNIFAAHLMVRRLREIGLFAQWVRFEYPEKKMSSSMTESPAPLSPPVCATQKQGEEEGNDE
jgi:hypothetical protein